MDLDRLHAEQAQVIECVLGRLREESRGGDCGSHAGSSGFGYDPVILLYYITVKRKNARISGNFHENAQGTRCCRADFSAICAIFAAFSPRTDTKSAQRTVSPSARFCFMKIAAYSASCLARRVFHAVQSIGARHSDE